MGVLLAASTPLGGDSGQWAQWGLAGLVVAYTLWRDREREKRMSEAIEAHHQWTRETMLTALERNSAAIERLTRPEREKEKA
jgi:hypothetical protein